MPAKTFVPKNDSAADSAAGRPRVGEVTRVSPQNPATTVVTGRVAGAAVSALDPGETCPTCGRGNPSKRTLGRTLLALFLTGIGGLWLLNPGAGFAFEILDNIPILGNIDEGVATMFLIAGLRYFGLEIPFLRTRR